MEFLKEIVFAIIGVAVPIIVTYLCRWLQSLYETNKVKIKNDKAQVVIGQVVDIITAAVQTTGNVYVKELKKDGIFDAAAQKEAFNRTYEAVKKQLTVDSSAVLEQVYGNAEEYLTNKIEQIVEEMKK